MPVILEKKDWITWLDMNTSYEQLNTLYSPVSNDFVEITQVNEIVNSVKNDSAECIKKSKQLKIIQETLF